MSLEEIRFPKPEISRITKLLCKVADYERDHPVAARWLIGALILAIVVIAAIKERV